MLSLWPISWMNSSKDYNKVNFLVSSQISRQKSVIISQMQDTLGLVTGNEGGVKNLHFWKKSLVLEWVRNHPPNRWIFYWKLQITSKRANLGRLICQNILRRAVYLSLNRTVTNLRKFTRWFGRSILNLRSSWVTRIV